MLHFTLPHRSGNATGSNGFSLIEILISLLVLSFGILGAMKMQLHSIQLSQQSNLYSTGMELTAEIAEKMRSNSSLRATNASPFLTEDFQSNKVHCCCHAANCVANQFDDAAIAEWIERINTALPNARAVICRDSAPWNSSKHSLTWDCASSKDASVVIKLGWSEQTDVDINPPPRIALAVSN